jgi:hypothetical protein
MENTAAYCIRPQKESKKTLMMVRKHPRRRLNKQQQIDKAKYKPKIKILYFLSNDNSYQPHSQPYAVVVYHKTSDVQLNLVLPTQSNVILIDNTNVL